MKEKIKNWLKNNWFKLGAIFILLGALGDNPYGYYQFLRWTILFIGGYSTYSAYKLKKIGWTWIFGAITILFNPIVPFYLSRDTWQIIDIIVAIIFFASLFIKYEREN